MQSSWYRIVMTDTIPTDLESTFSALNDILSSKDIDKIKNGRESDLFKYHHSLGRDIRNKWGLWTDSELAMYFRIRWIHHADDMSSIILTSYYRYLHGLPIDLESQIEHYRKFWEESNDF